MSRDLDHALIYPIGRLTYNSSKSEQLSAMRVHLLKFQMAPYQVWFSKSIIHEALSFMFGFGGNAICIAQLGQT